MRKLDVMQEGGYPFDDVTISYLQKLHNDRDSFLHTVFGNNKIVKGVVLDIPSNNYSDGLITIDDKMYHFVGGAPNTKISKQVIEIKRSYEDGLEKKAFINEFYEFGENGTDIIDFSDLNRWYQNQPITKEIKYVGSNVTNATLPEGWFIADGTNGTDDLSSKFIVGHSSTDTDYNAVGKTGGEKKHTLTENEMPSHKHGMEDGGDKTDSGYTNGKVAATDNIGTDYPMPNAFTKSVGGGQSHENRPPFYVMIIIQFIGI